MSTFETLTSEKRKCGNGVPWQHQHGVFSRHAALQLPRLRELKAKIAGMGKRSTSNPEKLSGRAVQRSTFNNENNLPVPVLAVPNATALPQQCACDGVGEVREGTRSSANDAKLDSRGGQNHFCDSAFSAQADDDKQRMAATAEEGTAPKDRLGKCGGSTSPTNSDLRRDVTAGETAHCLGIANWKNTNLRTVEGSSAGAVEQPSELFEAASQRSEMEGRARSAEFSFFIDEEELAQ